jgi:CRISPR-associated exonuclease Cas4
VQGHMLHERVDENAEEIRHDVRVERGLSLWSKHLGLVGRADVVEFRGDAPYPIEYKRGPPPAVGARRSAALCSGALSGGDDGARSPMRCDLLLRFAEEEGCRL